MRIWTTVYAWAGLLLPRAFKDTYFAQARLDLEEMLREIGRTRGARAAAWAGMAAVWDLARRIPVEWWAALRGREGGRGAARPKTGELIMSWMSDLHVAARSLRRRPGYAATAGVTLALGIGATAAIFTVVNAVILRPLPYPDADRIVFINHHAPALGLDQLSNSEGTINFYRKEADFIGPMAAYGQPQRNLVGDGPPERVTLGAVSPEIFSVLGVQPALGRPFNADDVKEGAPPVMILTDATWTTRFGRDPQVLGKTLSLDGTTTEIVGVMPEGFAFPEAEDVALIPLRIDPNGQFGTFGTQGIARLAPGITLEAAQRRATELQPRLNEFFPDLGAGFLEKAGWSVTVERYQDRLVGKEVTRALWVVLGTVLFVLLIAFANVANLFLVRAESRQKELAVRSAMGAGGGRIAAGFLSEALLLGLTGGIGGILLAWWGVSLLVAHGPADLPRLNEVAMDWTSLLFTGALSLAAALFLGAFPLVRFRGSAMASILRDGGRGSTDGRERHRTRSVLVAGQLALALVLLVGSGLMLRSFDQLRRVKPGFDPKGVLVMGMSLGEVAPDGRDAAAEFYGRVADAAAALPGVTSVGLTSRAPMGDGSANGGSFYIEGIERVEGDLPPVAMYKVIGRDYLETMRQPLLQGRRLTPQDWESGGAAAVVNETFAKKFLDDDAVGRAVRWDEEGDFARVVGVVQDAHEFSLRDEVRPMAYLPMRVGDWGYPGLSRMYMVIRGDGRTPLPVAGLRDVVHRLGPQVPILSVRTMDEIIARSIAQTSFTMILLGLAAGVALFLGAIGLFGVISYVVGQRTREIGVRVALGAAASDIRSMVFRQSAAVAVAGVAVGLLGAFGLTRLMTAVLFGVGATDPVTFIGAPVLLVLVAVLASWLPARRAARVDPVQALRSE